MVGVESPKHGLALGSRTSEAQRLTEPAGSFVLALACELAMRRNNKRSAARLAVLKATVEQSRLAKEDTFSDSLTQAEKEWLRNERSEDAKHWNVLTDLSVDQLRGPMPEHPIPKGFSDEARPPRDHVRRDPRTGRGGPGRLVAATTPSTRKRPRASTPTASACSHTSTFPRNTGRADESESPFATVRLDQRRGLPTLLNSCSRWPNTPAPARPRWRDIHL